MGLGRLADELEETARQSSALAETLAAGLRVLTADATASAADRAAATRQMMMALQGQDRIEQRCRGLASVARSLQEPGACTGSAWRALQLEELRTPERPQNSERRGDDVEVF